MPTRFRLPSALIALMLLFPCSPSLHAQEYGIEVEVVNENIGLLVGALGITDLTGYSTTHVYATTANSDDFVSSVSALGNRSDVLALRIKSVPPVTGP